MYNTDKYINRIVKVNYVHHVFLHEKWSVDENIRQSLSTSFFTS